MKILIIKPSSLGDVVHALPAVAMLRRAQPDAHIAWLVNDEYVPLVSLCPAVDEVIPFHRRRWARPWHVGELLGHVWQLRRQRFDLVLDLQGLLRSGLLAWCSRSPRRIGFAAAREGAPFFYTGTVRLAGSCRHAVERNLALVRAALGRENGTADAEAFPPLVRPPEVQGRVEQLLAAGGLAGAAPLLAVAPATRWVSKNWPAGSYAAFLRQFLDRFPGAGAVLLGSAGDRPDGERIAAETARPGRVLNLMGRTSLVELLEVLHRSGALVANDSGPVHLAAAAARPTVAIFGPTDPGLTGPYGNRHVVVRGECPSGPCFSAACRRNGGTLPPCLVSVRPETVLQAVEELLSGTTAVLSGHGGQDQ